MVGGGEKEELKVGGVYPSLSPSHHPPHAF